MENIILELTERNTRLSEENARLRKELEELRNYLQKWLEEEINERNG